MKFTNTIASVAEQLERWGATYKPKEIALFALGLVLVIGIADYAAGKNVSLSILYVLPVWIAAWYVGSAYAFALALLSVVIWISGDLATGMMFPDFLVGLWNGLVRLIFYALLLILFRRLKSLQEDLAKRVEDRAAALTHEIAERQRLERDLLEVSEREQRRIGQDLHDGLCQHLTGTALAAQVLAEKLVDGQPEEARDSQRIVDLIETAIVMARGMAKGLHPVEMGADGLMQALDEFTATTSEMFGIACRFECDSPVLVHAPAVATNLYRIAQEAVSNAIKHGRAKEIVVSLDNSEQGIKLMIADSGCGFPDPLPESQGMGLRIMANRARVIGATFWSKSGLAGGAEIGCILIPNAGAVHV